jgi:TrmH family RNA methyltransferase
MLSKNRIKSILSLQNKKFRKELNSFVIEGNKLIDEALKSDFEISTIIATKKWLNSNNIQKEVEIIETTDSEIKKVSSLSTPQEVVAIVKLPDTKIDFSTLSNKLSLVLDNIKDPGNLGTIVRLCDWFGIETIICSSETVDIYNSKTVQATMGSIFRVNTLYTDLSEFIQHFEKNSDFNIYGAFLNGENIYTSNLKKCGLIIMGSESHGISSEVEKFVTKKITIPKFTNSQTESLNVAISAAIICSEFSRS